MPVNFKLVSGQTLYNSLDSAGIAVNSQLAVVGQLMLDRNTKVKRLRIRLRGTINSIQQAIGPIDPRWASFGLNQPGLKAKPEVPENVSAVVLGDNATALEWEPSASAKYYRVWEKVDGVGMVAIGSPTDPNFMLENRPANSLAELAVSAVNDGGESALSEIVTVRTN